MSDNPPLAEQLHWAARVLLRVTAQGRSLPQALGAVPVGPRPGVQALCFHALRHWGEARVLTQALAERPPAADVACLLGVALTLLFQTHGQSPSYAAHTVVDQAVAALQHGPRHAAAGFVNACLRRFLRESTELRAAAQTDLEARWNHPFWWIKQVRRDHPQHWMQILQASQQAAPMVLRVNRRQHSRDTYLRQLQAGGRTAWALGEDGVMLEHPCDVHELPGWAQGAVSVQDGSAQWAAPLLLDGAGLSAGARVLDACAAPGGKTAHLLERADLDVWALEIDAQRLKRIEDNLQRLHLRAQVRCADAGDPASWWDGQPFDAILLDAPCTASGIVRRQPDVRWLRRPEDVGQLAQQQRRLLDALWPLLRPGGRLLYATCSVFRAEGEDQMEAFARRHPEAQRLPAPGHLLPGRCNLDPQAVGMDDNVARGFDGFFYSLWHKPPG